MAATITPGYTLTLGEDYDPVFINAILNALTIGSIIGAEIAAGTILGSNIASGTIEGSNIAAATITGTNIVADAIGATHIASNSISADDIQTDAITATKIIAGAITTDKIAALAVTTDKIEALAITSAKIAADAIESSHIASNTIEADMIKTDAVTAVKIQAAAVTSDKIYAGAVTSDKISVNSLDAISANLGTVTSGTVTAATVQTSADPAVSRVKMYAGGLYGYDAVLGNTFRLPTDGTAPYFASGNIISGTITNTTIVTNDFKTSSSLPWIELTASGLALRISGSGGLYDTGVYDTATYGAGVTAYLGNSAKPFLSMEIETTLADLRLFARSSNPSGAAEIGDIAFVSGTLRACTTAGTPGTYKTLAFTDSAITSSMYIGTTSVALNRASAALTLAGITLTTPDIGTPSAGTLTSCTSATQSQGDNSTKLATTAYVDTGLSSAYVKGIMDFMEYSTDTLAQAAYVTNAPPYVSNADIDDEDMADITDWTDSDGGDGASTQVTFDSKSCMKLDNGSAGAANYSYRQQDIGSFGARTVITMNMYFDAIGTIANLDVFRFSAYDGATRLFVTFASDGLYVYDGATHNEVGTDLVVQDVWQEWTFDINWVAQTVDVYLNKVLQASGVDCSVASATAEGTIYLVQYGNTTANRISYIDLFKAGSDFADGAGLQSYSESTIKSQGSYALKGVATMTSTLNKTLTKTF